MREALGGEWRTTVSKCVPRQRTTRPQEFRVQSSYESKHDKLTRKPPREPLPANDQQQLARAAQLSIWSAEEAVGFIGRR